MSGFNHGIGTVESPTSIIAIKVDGITPCYVGTAPINLSEEKNVNKPVLCNTYAEAVQAFGYVKDFENFTLCEAIDAHFSKFGVGPIVLINVLDPSIHKTTVVQESVPIGENKTIIIKKIGILKETLKLEPELEHVSEFDDDGFLNIIITATEGIPEGNNIKITYDCLDTTLVEADDIIGGIDQKTGKNKGLECIEDVFPITRLVPSLILAPKFSTDAVVAAVMETKASLINGHFKAVALVDIDTKKVKKYTDVPQTKELNNINSTYLDVSYPKVALGNLQYHLSTQRACIIQNMASESEGIPYQSPSNSNIKCDRTCLADGTDMLLAINQANYLNGNGITTAINWIGGWRIWGNRTSCYPANTDAKDAFLAARLMFNFLNNTIITNFWNKVDKPTNTTLIKTVKDSINIWLNGLQAAGMIIGARIEFRPTDNPLTSLLDGKVKFKIYFSPALPMEYALFDCEIDTNYYSNLFAA
ncbi:phage tail sheath family protein [Fusobacterium varium]|uniref:phage tail sheath family protein n=1 Tax=Fusobacterium varium TaxID=856 RepID=UPI003F07C4D6